MNSRKNIIPIMDKKERCDEIFYIPDRMGIVFDVMLQGNSCKLYVRMLML